jgi:hypothetical protein
MADVLADVFVPYFTREINSFLTFLILLADILADLTGTKNKGSLEGTLPIIANSERQSGFAMIMTEIDHNRGGGETCAPLTRRTGFFGQALSNTVWLGIILQNNPLSRADPAYYTLSRADPAYYT